MESKEYLVENSLQNSKTKKIILTIIIISTMIGLSLILIGVVKHKKVNLQYTEEYRKTIKEKLEQEKQLMESEQEKEKQKILNTITETETKIKPTEDQITSLKKEKFTGYNDEYYKRQDKIKELEASIAMDKTLIEVLNKALSESFNNCIYAEMKINNHTSKYCEIKMDLITKNNEINNIDYKYSDYNKQFEASKYIAFYMIGGFVIIIGIMIALLVHIFSKRKNIINN